MCFVLFFNIILSVICFQSFRAKFDACINPFFYSLYFSGKKEDFGTYDAIAEQNVTILQK